MTRIIRNPTDEHHQSSSTTPHQAQSQAHHTISPSIHDHTTTSQPSSSPLPPSIYPPQVLSALTLLDPTAKSSTHIIPPKHGHAFRLPAGKSFRVVDLHGEQVVDLMAWTTPGDRNGQHTSMSYTRYSLRSSAPPIVGESIHSNLGTPMLELTADTVKCHDMLFMACNPSFYAEMGEKGHRNCAENISGEVRRLCGLEEAEGGFGWNHIIDPFNIFQNTPYYSLKPLGSSKAGDHIEFRNVLGVDIVVGLSCCPFEGDGFNGGKVTEVGVVVEV